MNDRDDVAEYLFELNTALDTRLDRAERILTEINDHLQSDISERVTKGAGRQEAEQAAIACLGPPQEVARRFGSDLPGSFHARLGRLWEWYDPWAAEHPWLGALVFPLLPLAAFFLVMTVPMWLMFSSVDNADSFTVYDARLILTPICVFLAFGARNRAVMRRKEPGLRARVKAWSGDHPWLAGGVLTSGVVFPGMYEIYAIATGRGKGILITLMGAGIFLSTVYMHTHQPACSVCAGQRTAAEPRALSRPKWLDSTFRFVNDHWFPAIVLIHLAVSGAWIFVGSLAIFVYAPKVLLRAVRYLRGERWGKDAGSRYRGWSLAHPWLQGAVLFVIVLAPLVLLNLILSEPLFPPVIFAVIFPPALILLVISLISRKARKDSLPQTLTTEPDNI